MKQNIDEAITRLRSIATGLDLTHYDGRDEDINAVLDEVERLRGELEERDVKIGFLRSSINAHIARGKVLEGALEFYAKETSYSTHIKSGDYFGRGIIRIMEDRGDKARAALDALEVK